MQNYTGEYFGKVTPSRKKKIYIYIIKNVSVSPSLTQQPLLIMTFILTCLSKVTKYNIFSRWAYFVKKMRQVSVKEASDNVQVERLTSYLHPTGELPKPVLITAFCTLIQGWKHFHRNLRCVCAGAGKLRLAQLSMRHRGLQPIKPWFKHVHFGGTEQFQRNCESEPHTERADHTTKRFASISGLNYVFQF